MYQDISLVHDKAELSWCISTAWYKILIIFKVVYITVLTLIHRPHKMQKKMLVREISSSSARLRLDAESVLWLQNRKEDTVEAGQTSPRTVKLVWGLCGLPFRTVIDDLLRRGLPPVHV